MFASLFNFLKRHRRKFLVGGAVIGGTYVAVKYAKKRLGEMQDAEAAECLAFARKQHHFDSNQRTCNVTAFSLLPSIRDTLINSLNTEALTLQLKSRPSNKVEIWEELKIMSFTRTICCVYTVGMMVVVLRVQLNIIGGYMYLDTQSAANSHTREDVLATPEVQAKYLENIHYLLGQGLNDLIVAVRKAVSKVLESVSLKELLSLTDIQEILRKVRHQVEYRQTSGYHDASTSSLCTFMMPEDDQLTEAGSMTREEITYARLMKETRDMLECADFQSVLTTCLDTAFTRLVDKVAEYFRPVTTEEVPMTNSMADVHMAVAKVIPVMNGLIHTVCADAPNQYIQELLLKEQMKDFAANVYEAFSQPPPGQTRS